MATTIGYSQSVIPASLPEGASLGDETDDQAYWSLSRVKRAYLSYVGSKREEIQEQQAARCYRHGAQWTTSQVEIFNRRKQPVVTYNRIGRKIDSVVGLMEKLKQAPKAYPRNPTNTDETGAELATAVVRYVVESELREVLFPKGISNAAMDGIGGIEMMLVQGDKGDTDVGFAMVETDSFFYDPRSFTENFDDARYMGQGKWVDLDDAIQLFPDKEDLLSSMVESGSELTSSPDRERRWFQNDQDQKRVRIVDIWYKHNGGWCWCMFTGSEKLAEGQGYFYDEKGRMICKYIMFSSFVDQDGDRYGFVRNLRSSQDEINQRRSKGLHELVSRRITAEDGAFGDIELARREAVRPDGVVIYNKGFEMAFDDAARQANIEGQFKFLEDAKNEIENFGPNPALIGQGLEYKSGRAINLLQQAGLAELGPFVIGVKDWKLRIYRAIWAAVQRYWTAERWIRVTGDDGVAQFVQLNGVGVDASGMPRMINAVGQLDVNFTLDEGPDEVNMMADAYDTLIALSSQGAKVPPEILIELAPVQASTKRKLLSILKQPDPMQLQQQQLELAGAAAQVDQTKSQATLNMANAQEAVAKAQAASTAGGASVQEKQMELAISAQEHQAKMTEASIKANAEQNKARADLAGTFAKLQSERLRSEHDIGMQAIKNAQQLRHTQQMHELKMRQTRANGPNGGTP